MAERAQRKSSDACMRRMIEHHGAAVYRLAFSRLRNAADAEDVSQTVFLKLHATAPSFADTDHERAWLLRVTVNCCNDLHRSPWRRFVARGDSAAEAAEEALALQACDRHRDQVANEEMGQRIEDAMESLTDVQRTVVHLFYYEDCSTLDIAAITGLRAATVRSHLHRARKALEQQLGDLL